MAWKGRTSMIAGQPYLSVYSRIAWPFVRSCFVRSSADMKYMVRPRATVSQWFSSQSAPGRLGWLEGAAGKVPK